MKYKEVEFKGSERQFEKLVKLMFVERDCGTVMYIREKEVLVFNRIGLEKYLSEFPIPGLGKYNCCTLFWEENRTHGDMTITYEDGGDRVYASVRLYFEIRDK